MLKELLLKNRSYRRFYQSETISKETLLDFINLARFAPSAKNSQPLKYYISNSETTNSEIFSTLSWAGYLTDWDGPIEGEQPSAYIVVLLDKNITENNFCDHGFAIQTILLAAVEKGFGGCTIAAFNKTKLSKIINTPENMQELLVIALGKPKETVNIYEISDNESIKYWRDENKIHKVPKRKLIDIVINKN
jgi:nitroreductase